MNKLYNKPAVSKIKHAPVLSVKDLAEITGKSRSYISTKLKLANDIEPVCTTKGRPLYNRAELLAWFERIAPN